MNSKDNTNVKQNNPATKQLAQLRKSLDEIEELRYKSIKSKLNFTKSNPAMQQSTLQLEQAAVELRRAERALITKLGTDIASKIKADGESLEALASKIRKRVEKMGRLPKRLDAISKAILNIITLI
ncbi:MAG: hypothetical protein ACD_77C00257G0008 [uncultured bacterium]|nr:MAG: hypothetical protein ACD_77C00257G0008 [uncultured bacterium]HBY02394.1 hypothetical protein [Rikenellaceae bacterium]